MEHRTLITVGQDGRLYSFVTTNDNTLQLGDNLVTLDISDSDIKDELRTNMKDYRVKKNKNGKFDKNGIEKLDNTK